MRIIAGAWRGRMLVAPAGPRTRPTADRVRQALFDMLMHADWGGRSWIEGAVVLDAFAGSGALGLEALSRGAAFACFIESDRLAVQALQANVAACKAEDRTEVLPVDVFRAVKSSPPGKTCQKSSSILPSAGKGGGISGPASLVFLDPPYGQNLVPRAIEQLRRFGRIRSDALVVAETGSGETWTPAHRLLAERQHGAARIMIFRLYDQ